MILTFYEFITVENNYVRGSKSEEDLKLCELIPIISYWLCIKTL